MAHESDASVLSWIFEILLKAVGAAGLGLIAAWGWFGKQIAHLSGQLDTLESDTVKRMAFMDNRISDHATRLAVGERDFENLRQQLEQVLQGQNEMAKKQDRVLELVMDLRQGRHRQ